MDETKWILWFLFFFFLRFYKLKEKSKISMIFRSNKHTKTHNMWNVSILDALNQKMAKRSTNIQPALAWFYVCTFENQRKIFKHPNTSIKMESLGVIANNFVLFCAMCVFVYRLIVMEPFKSIFSMNFSIVLLHQLYLFILWNANSPSLYAIWIYFFFSAPSSCCYLSLFSHLAYNICICKNSAQRC